MRLTPVLTTLLLTLSPAVQAGELAGAAVTTRGQVWTNGVALPSGTTVHSGDRIVTGQGSSALIWSRTTGRVEIRERSEVTIEENEVRLHRGVVASGKVSVRFGDSVAASQEPAGAESWFVVSARQERPLIAAHRGDVLISRTGAAAVLVPSGSYAVPSGGEDPKPNESKRKKNKDKSSKPARGAAAAGGVAKKTQGGWTIGSLSHGASVALVAGVGAAAVGGTIAAVGLTGSSPSPSE